MSLIFTESFCGIEQNTFSEGPRTKLNYFEAVLVGAHPAARTNGYHCTGNSDGEVGRFLSATDEHATLIAGAAYNRVAAQVNTSAKLMSFRSDTPLTGAANRKHVSIAIGTDRKISAWRGDAFGGTLLGASTIPVMGVGGSWFYVEAKVTLGAAGSVDVTVDGINVLSLSGVNTQNGGTKTVFDAMHWYADNVASICDLYLCNGAGSKNNTFLNCPKIVWLAPNGNGSVSQGLGSDGNSTNNYQLVDEPAGTAPSGVDYIDLADTDDQDIYTFENATDVLPTNAVRGVIVWTTAQKTDAGNRRLINVANGVETNNEGEVIYDSAYATVKGVAEPSGWSVATLDAAQFGVKAGVVVP